MSVVTARPLFSLVDLSGSDWVIYYGACEDDGGLGSNSVFIASCGGSLDTQLGDVVGRSCSEYIGVVGAELKKFIIFFCHALKVLTLMLRLPMFEELSCDHRVVFREWHC